MDWLSEIAQKIAPPGYKRLAGAIVRQVTRGTAKTKAVQSSLEAQVRDRLARSIPGSITEVMTEFGRIDILTPTEVIEVKRASQWKQAIGQVEIYRRAYPHHRPRIHLFGKTKHKTLIQNLCKSKGIRCTFASEDMS
jgi:hypothetical protein